MATQSSNTARSLSRLAAHDAPGRHAWLIQVTDKGDEWGWHWQTMFDAPDDAWFGWGDPEWIRSTASRARIRDEFRPGDVALLYQAAPDQAVLGLARIATEGDDEFHFEFDAWLQSAPLAWVTLRDDPVLAGSEKVRMKKGTIFRLSPAEFARTVSLMEPAPDIVAFVRNELQLDLTKSSPRHERLEALLRAFADVAPEWFDGRMHCLEHVDFFADFTRREHLETAVWEDFQEIGPHVHAFNNLAIARSRALGKPNRDIEHYRRVFLDLVHGDGDVADRVRRFWSDPAHNLPNFGKAAKSEIIGYLFGEELILWNERDTWALEVLGLTPERPRGQSQIDEYLAFNDAVGPVVEAYLEVVGRQTDYPVRLEVDQFFSWMYEHQERDPVASLIAPSPARPRPGSQSNSPEPHDAPGDDDVEEPSADTLDDAERDIFLERSRIEEILWLLRHRRNIVLQGPPGCGKTFIARRLAWLLTGKRDDSSVRFVQFHQSFGYEDFVQGYRPTPDGGFERRNGIFLRLCQQAANAPDIPHVLIIDEINRGNLSRIFGELLMLLEADKRRPEYAVELAYARGDEPLFWVPSNLYVIGTMNTADRSLALVDYALRRRFAFVDVPPAYGSPQLAAALLEAGLSRGLRDHIVACMSALNETIADDTRSLGAGYCLGHSYFCAGPDGGDEAVWFERIVRTEVAPLLGEYWFDAPDRVASLTTALLDEVGA